MNLPVFNEYYFWFEVSTLIIATFVTLTGKVNIPAFKTISLYMLFIVAFEIIADLLEDDRVLTSNLINRLVIPAEFAYILMFGYVLVRNKKLKKAVLVSLLLYVVMLAKDWFFPSGAKASLYVASYTAGVLALLLLCAFLYYELLNSASLFKFYKQPVFLFFTGVTIFYLGTLPIHLYWNLASSHDIPLLIKLKHLFDGLMCTMYVFFSFSMLAFLWNKD